MYMFFRSLLFRLDPELSHDVALDALSVVQRIGILPLYSQIALKCKQLFNKSSTLPEPIEVMGLKFPNAVGLAAGLDKNGDYFEGLAHFGFGFIEIGTVTPKPQSGNDQPRLFRLTTHDAIINRMGFNSKGVDHLVGQVKKRHFKGVLGINIGKNKTTCEANALQDYQICMEKVAPFADYITVNISSPNTPGLRDLQFGETLKNLLEGIKVKQLELEKIIHRYVPVAVKIAPDMSNKEIIEVGNTILASGLDAIIATNTTIDKMPVEGAPFASEAGGLSGRPLKDKSTHVIKMLAMHFKRTEKSLPIIGVGGIISGVDAKEKMDAGASLVQVYSGLIYQGFSLVTESVKAINR